jgi:hypothetical protein
MVGAIGRLADPVFRDATMISPRRQATNAKLPSSGRMAGRLAGQIVGHGRASIQRLLSV